MSRRATTIMGAMVLLLYADVWWCHISSAAGNNIMLPNDKRSDTNKFGNEEEDGVPKDAASRKDATGKGKATVEFEDMHHLGSEIQMAEDSKKHEAKERIIDDIAHLHHEAKERINEIEAFDEALNQLSESASKTKATYETAKERLSEATGILGAKMRADHTELYSLVLFDLENLTQ